MITLMVVVFMLGYVAIAMEHRLKINKSATAITLGVVLWTMYIFIGDAQVVEINKESFDFFLKLHPESLKDSLSSQVSSFIGNYQILNHLGDIASILFFLLCAMTIVELIDSHGGFAIITKRITTKNKRKLLWIIAILAFFLSSVLDNLTTAIVMVMLVRKLLPEQNDRWIFGGIVIIAANSGGAWSPIGDITTIMLWINENVTSSKLLEHLFLPSLVSLLVPLIILSKKIKGGIIPNKVETYEEAEHHLPYRFRLSIFICGVGGLIFVPVFKSITHLPPFMGILLSLGVLWIFSEIVYNLFRRTVSHGIRRIPFILTKIDMPTILFFLGILMAVAALECVGVLHSAAVFLDREVHNTYLINTIIGLLSSVFDNVPLVAASMGMYPIATPEMVQASANPEYLSHFVQDGTFWQLLTFCAGTGGSILIIGSAAGVVVMGLEKIDFVWYLKNITLLALLGFFAGIGTFMLQMLIF